MSKTPKWAKGMLAQLKSHYGEPVLPLSEFCAAIETWKEAIEQGVKDSPDVETQQGRFYHDHLPQMFTDIRKSGLLSRILYAGEKLRTRKCPYHEGHMDCGQWVGAGKRDPSCKCDGSGWIAEEKDATK